MKLRRVFSKEFKLSILRELEVKPLVEVSRTHSLSPTILSRWKREYEQNPKEAFSGHGKVWKEDAKIAQYERLLGQVYAENAFLKKALETLKQFHAEERRKNRCSQ
jgi:transposase-like protein